MHPFSCVLAFISELVVNHLLPPLEPMLPRGGSCLRSYPGGALASLRKAALSIKFFNSSESDELFFTINTPQYIENIHPIKMYARNNWKTPTMNKVLLHFSQKQLLIIVPLPYHTMNITKYLPGIITFNTKQTYCHGDPSFGTSVIKLQTCASFSSTAMTFSLMNFVV